MADLDNLTIKPGSIVRMRNRLWRIDEFDGTEVIATPITGDSKDRRTFLADIENIKEERFEPINPNLPGNLAAQQLLLRAYRFDLIHGSAPFLSLHQSSVVPYNYQMVPLVLALEKPTARMLIADDVGLGKTIEAGLIISELLRRGKLKRVLFLTPANLKQQWKEAMDYFFHIKTTIIDSFSRKEFEKELPAGANPWQHFRFVIASVDYAKFPDIKQQILEQPWDFLLTDEVHLCARPHGASPNVKQQKRYELIKELGQKIPNVLFLTATPHNGYSDSFASILQIINPEIVRQNSVGDYIFDKPKARHNVIQRNRHKLEAWYGAQGLKSPFPKRDQKEVIISPKTDGKLLKLLEAVERYGDYILASANKNASLRVRNIANWVAFHFQKRAISSPYAVLKSLENRVANLQAGIENMQETVELHEGFVADLFSDDERISEEMASYRLDFEALSENEISELKRILEFGASFQAKDDEKLQHLKNVVLPELMQRDPKTILFTKYKDTLDYLEKNLKNADFEVFTMHGDMSLNARTEIFVKFEHAKRAVLIATDVISEGLNLQRLASNVVHYELPWNPNRLEQRNGRIDRIGQKHATVRIRTLVLDKSLDKEILDLLLEKQRTIEIDRDYAAAYFGDEEYLKSMILEASKRKKAKRNTYDPNQLDMFAAAAIDETKKAVRQSFSTLEEDKKRKLKIEAESFYTGLDIELPEIDKRIEETKRIVGSQTEVLWFVKAALARFNSALTAKGAEFYEIEINDPRLLLQRFGSSIKKVTFNPEVALTNPDAVILDAGHPLVRKLIELVKAEFLTEKGVYGRNAYFFSDQTQTVVYKYNFLLRFTTGIKEKRVIEELVTLNYDSFAEQLIDTELQASETTQTIAANDLAEYITDALCLPALESFVRQKIKQRREKLSTERRELYKKILVDSRTTEQPEWLDEILYIDEAGYDLLTLTIIKPLN